MSDNDDGKLSAHLHLQLGATALFSNHRQPAHAFAGASTPSRFQVQRRKGVVDIRLMAINDYWQAMAPGFGTGE